MKHIISRVRKIRPTQFEVFKCAMRNMLQFTDTSKMILNFKMLEVTHADKYLSVQVDRSEKLIFDSASFNKDALKLMTSES